MKTSKRFSLCIDEVFEHKEKCVIVTGRVNYGSVKVGDCLKIITKNKVIQTSCRKLEKFREEVTKANVGDYIGIVLSNVSKSDLQGGMFIISKI